MYSEDDTSPPLRIPEPEVHTNGVTAYAFEDEDSYSPRSELLSSPPGDRHTHKSKVRSHTRTKTRPSARYRKDRERAHAHEPHNELLRLLIEREYEADRLQRALENASVRIDAEAQRAAEAERVARETFQHVRLAGDARAMAQTEASRARDELAMYRVQVANAQREIDRAQEVVRGVERQRDDAERAAARARSTARRLTRELLAEAAREEGRLVGFQDGLRQARAEVRDPPRRRRRHHQRRRRAPTETEEEGPYSDDYDYEYYGDEYDYDAAYAARHTPRNRAADETLPSSPGGMPMRTVDVGPISPETSAFGQPQPSPHPLSPPRTRMSFPTEGAPTEPMTEPEPDPTPVLEHPPGPSPSGYVPPHMRTPSVQTYSLEIPPAEEVEREINGRGTLRRNFSSSRRPAQARREYDQGSASQQPIYSNPRRQYDDDEDDDEDRSPPAVRPVKRSPEEILAEARRLAEQARLQQIADQQVAAMAREEAGGGGIFSTLRRTLTGRSSKNGYADDGTGEHKRNKTWGFGMRRERPGLQRNLSVIEEQSTPSSARRGVGHQRSQSENVVPRMPFGRQDISPDIPISVQPPSRSPTTPSKQTPSRDDMRGSREHLPRNDGFLSPRMQSGSSSSRMQNQQPTDYGAPMPHTPGSHYVDDWAGHYTPQERAIIDAEGWKGLLHRTEATPTGTSVRGGPPLAPSGSSSRGGPSSGMRGPPVAASGSSSRAGGRAGGPRRMRSATSSRSQAGPSRSQAPPMHAPRPSAPVTAPPVPFSPQSVTSGLRGSSMTTREHQMAFKASPASAFPALPSPSMAFPPLPPLAPTTSAEPTTRPGSAMSRRSARSLRAEADRAREARDGGGDRMREDREDQARLARELHRPSSRASSYGHYDPSTYVDPAFVRSAEDLTLPQQATPRSRSAEMANTPRSRQRALSREDLRSRQAEDPRARPPAPQSVDSRHSQSVDSRQSQSRGTSDGFGAETDANTRANAKASAARARGGGSAPPPSQQSARGQPYAPPAAYQGGPPAGFQGGPPAGFQGGPPAGYQGGPPAAYHGTPYGAPPAAYGPPRPAPNYPYAAAAPPAGYAHPNGHAPSNVHAPPNGAYAAPGGYSASRSAEGAGEPFVPPAAQGSPVIPERPPSRSRSRSPTPVPVPPPQRGLRREPSAYTDLSYASQ